MKKKFVMTLIFSTLFFLTGCGFFFNGDKELLYVYSSYTPKEDLKNIYYLSYSSGKETIWETWNYNASYMKGSISLIELSKQEEGTYKTGAKYPIGSKTNGYNCTIELSSSSSLPDALMLAYSSSNKSSVFVGLSNVIPKENYIHIIHDDPTTWPTNFWLAKTGSSGSISSSQPQTGHNDISNIQSNDQLWINLDNKIWVCLGAAK